MKFTKALALILSVCISSMILVPGCSSNEAQSNSPYNSEVNAGNPDINEDLWEEGAVPGKEYAKSVDENPGEATMINGVTVYTDATGNRVSIQTLNDDGSYSTFLTAQDYNAYLNAINTTGANKDQAINNFYYKIIDDPQYLNYRNAINQWYLDVTEVLD